MHLRRLLVEQAAHPGVVDERLRRRLELHVAVDTAPAVHGAEEALAGRHVVLHLRHDRRVRAGRHEVRHVVLVRAAVVVHERHLPVVHPEPAHGLHAADLEPHALALPRGGDRHRLAVPAVPHVLVADGLRVVVALLVPAVAHAGLAHALRLPAGGHLDRALVGPYFCLVERFPDAVPLQVAALSGEFPLPAQRDDAPRFVPHHRVHHRGMLLAPAPCQRQIGFRPIHASADQHGGAQHRYLFHHLSSPF